MLSASDGRQEVIFGWTHGEDACMLIVFKIAFIVLVLKKESIKRKLD